MFIANRLLNLPVWVCIQFWDWKLHPMPAILH